MGDIGEEKSTAANDSSAGQTTPVCPRNFKDASSSMADTTKEGDVGLDSGWQEVHHKRSFSPTSVAYSVDSPTPLNTFKHLAQVDEIDAKRALYATLSKSKQKKGRRPWGSLLIDPHNVYD